MFNELENTRWYKEKNETPLIMVQGDNAAPSNTPREARTEGTETPLVEPHVCASFPPSVPSAPPSPPGKRWQTPGHAGSVRNAARRGSAGVAHPLAHGTQGAGRAPDTARPLLSASGRRGRGGRPRGAAAPRRNPGRGWDTLLPWPFGSRARCHLEGPGSGREIPSCSRNAPNLRPPAPADPRPPRPRLLPSAASRSLARSLGTGSMQRSALG